jgi:hypothetical protein
VGAFEQSNRFRRIAVRLGVIYYSDGDEPPLFHINESTPVLMSGSAVASDLFLFSSLRTERLNAVCATFIELHF